MSQELMGNRYIMREQRTTLKRSVFGFSRLKPATPACAGLAAPSATILCTSLDARWSHCACPAVLMVAVCAVECYLTIQLPITFE